MTPLGAHTHTHRTQTDHRRRTTRSAQFSKRAKLWHTFLGSNQWKLSEINFSNSEQKEMILSNIFLKNQINEKFFFLVTTSRVAITHMREKVAIQI